MDQTGEERGVDGHSGALGGGFIEPIEEPLYDCVVFAMQRFMDETGGPDRICNYCFHPRSSEFCKTSHPYP